MSLPTLLFVLRLVGGVLLLLFAGLIGWYLARDLRAVRLQEAASQIVAGGLRVVNSTLSNQPAGMQYDLLPTTLIGRGPRCTIILDEPYVSAEHATLTRRDKRWWVEDLDSRNGTLLNDIDVREPTVITHGDVIAIGSTQLELVLNEAGLRD